MPRCPLRTFAPIAALLLTSPAGALGAQDRSQSRSMVQSHLGVVASESVLASQVGARILEQGGNCLLYTSPSPRD